MALLGVVILLFARGNISAAFLNSSPSFSSSSSVLSSKEQRVVISMTASSTNTQSKSQLFVPTERDEIYGTNIAQYLLDLNDNGATFDFCGGMMFQLQLTDKLRSHLASVASSSSTTSKHQQPIIHSSSMSLMNRIPNYEKSAFADNISIFHGRELRKVDNANGGMGFVLQLSYADPSGSVSTIDDSSKGRGGGENKGATATWSGTNVDTQGWSNNEILTYDGWRSDKVRQWRDAKMYETEGVKFTNIYGEKAFGLNHRFFLHFDDRSRMWLCAEDGCEGTPSEGKSLMSTIGGMLFGK